jgi:hypothetical protein
MNALRLVPMAGGGSACSPGGNNHRSQRGGERGWQHLRPVGVGGSARVGASPCATAW